MPPALVESLEPRLLFSGLSIAQENQLPGTAQSVWDVPGGGDPTLLGFTADISVNQGQTVSFKIDDSVLSAYQIQIYRLGYYHADGARLVTTINSVVALIEPAPIIDPNTGLIDCGNWAVAATWATPANATSGVYIADLVKGGIAVSQIPFVIRNDSDSSAILYQTSDSTWQAYNSYGGDSLYEEINGNQNHGYDSSEGSPRAFAVSYNRPFIDRGENQGPLEGYLFDSEFPMIQWLEQNGYDVSYSTDVDTARFPSHLMDHQIFMDCGHDEYWSAEQRNNVQAAINAGIDAAFFSGNTSFWETRWSTSIDGTNTDWRTMICYKDTLANTPIDPSGAWTGAWRDTRFPDVGGANPENALTGTISQVNGTRNDSITVSGAFSSLRIWRNTNVANLNSNQSVQFPAGTLGYEWDVDQDNGFRPAGEIDLSGTTLDVSPKLYLNYGSQFGSGVATHSLTLHKASSGAQVFSAGSTQFSWGLSDNHDRSGSDMDPDMQQMAVNLLAGMGVQPNTLQSGVARGSVSTDNQAPVSTITSPTPGTQVVNGVPITISGTASDLGGGVVAGVEVSVDGGASWHPATGFENFTYTWIPRGNGNVTIESRATDDSLNTETPSDGVVINTRGPFGVFTLDQSPNNPSQNDSSAVTLGMQFTSSISGLITGVRFYKGAGNDGAHVGSLWSDSGTLLATATFVNESAGGWQTVGFSQPVLISAGTTYVVSYFAPQGHYAEDPIYFGTDVSAQSLTALADGTRGEASGSYSVGASNAFPTHISNGANFWVDVVFKTPPSDSFWNQGSVPNNPSANDSSAIEVGLRFTSSQAGSIEGIRFFKSGQNTGTHVGNLWDTSGNLLDRITFTNESASGWQRADFTTPIFIAPFTPYIASYFAPNGHYAKDNYFFSISGMASGPLYTPDSSTTGNGVFAYGSHSIFPGQSFLASNYWVDVIFQPGAAALAISAGQHALIGPAPQGAAADPFSYPTEFPLNGDDSTTDNGVKRRKSPHRSRVI